MKPALRSSRMWSLLQGGRSLSRAWRIAICLGGGGHIYDSSEWGYSYAGVVDLYCGRCGARYAQVPLEDFEGAGQVLSLVASDMGSDDA